MHASAGRMRYTGGATVDAPRRRRFEMKMPKKILLAVAAGVGSVGLFGAAALGTFGPEASASVVSAVTPAASAILGEDKDGHDGLKKILDGLVQKGVITQQQEDAILAAAKDAKTDKVR